MNKKDNQIIILNVVSGHLLSYYYNWLGDFKQKKLHISKIMVYGIYFPCWWILVP